MGSTLAETLREYLSARGWSPARLAKVSGVSPKTISRWTTGLTPKVQSWQPLADVARALELSRVEADALFAAGQQPSIEHLLAQELSSEDRALLARWVRVHHGFSYRVPVPITRFVGRDEEMNDLTAMLAEKREVTVVGFGGYGKTRLALEASQAMRHMVDGAYFVDLAAIRDPLAVIPIIAETVGVRATQDETLLQSLISWLGDARVLLILDNVEQVLDAALDVATLLRNTGNVKALVTSRIPINIRGEHLFSIDPLPLPDPDASYATMRVNPAVALFADRAKGSDRHFGLTTRNAPLIAEICMRLDGMPLAIELAAARLRDVPLAKLLERFPSRMEIAASGPRDVDERQRTLRATIAWSFDLLEGDAQRLFALLSVFAGGFSRAAAEAVGATLHLSAEALTESLDSLVVHQLVRDVRHRTSDGRERFAMLETIRENAAERLLASGTIETVQRAHAMYYVDLGERAEMEGAGQAEWLDRLAAERDNVQAALDWCGLHHERTIGLRLCLGYMPLWELREPAMVSFARIQPFMADATSEWDAPTRRARGLVYQGLLLMRATGALESASERFAEALTIFQREQDPVGECKTLQALGDVDRYRQEWERASTRYRASLALAERIGSPYLVAHAYMGLAFASQELPDRMAEAEHFCALTLEWAERSGHRVTIAQAANSMGEMARHRGSWREARRYYEHALQMAIEIESSFRVAMVQHNLGYVAIGNDDLPRARSRFTESLHLYERMRDGKGQAECLAGFARVEVLDGNTARAARQCGGSQAILDKLRTRLDTMDQSDFDRTMASLRSTLGTRLEALLAEGRTMSIESLVS